MLVDAASCAGLPQDGWRTVRIGERAVFRHDATDLIAKVGRSAQRFAAAKREVRVARWLTSSGLPVERPFDVAQPDATCALPVTFWHAVAGEWTTPDRLAEILRELHKLTPPAYLALPKLDPFARMRERLVSSPGLKAEVRDELESMIARQETELPVALAGREDVVLHGDANIGNILLLTAEDEAILLDLEGFCLGPRIWDLMITAVYRDLGWHTEAEYAAFCAAYGETPSDDPAFPTVAAVQQLRMVCWLAQRTGDYPVIAEEFATRLADLRDPARPRLWRPY
ncbi:aminoglycoside phosphotransferase (APT) family kinase protein [Catenulispora sp. GAS73]|uniref:phosphotransferase enzyme family protein n=1 Tax=Catenulispora sp. GAS73 TaxID=3156269 RepID=UPI0035145590